VTISDHFTKMSHILTPENINALKVPELRKELKDRGITLPASAKKGDLVAKLREVVEGAAVGHAIVVGNVVQQPTVVQATVSQSAASGQQASPTKTIIQPQSSNGTTTATMKLTKATAEIPSTATSTPSAVSTTGIKKVSSVSTVKPIERIAARAARFGVTSSASTTPSLPTPETSTTIKHEKVSEQLEVLKKRADRFGEVVSTTVKTLEEKEKLTQRAQRFNLSAEEVNPVAKLGLIKKSPPGKQSISAPTTTTTVKRSAEEEERLRKRRERFGLVA